MIRLPFLRRASDRRAEVLAEAIALIEDGMGAEAVLALYEPEDAEWLEPLLETGQVIGGAYAAEEPSYYFEASLKAKFLAAAEPVIGEAPRQPAPERRRPPFALGTALASSTVVAAAAGLGVLMFGFITAGNAVPGDWNYSLKLATERAQYTLASRDQRIDVQIRQTEERLTEISELANRGNLSAGEIHKLTRELGQLLDLARDQQFDQVQQARVKGIAESTVAVLSGAEQEFEPDVADAINSADAVVAAVAGGGVSGLEAPTATATPTASPTPVDTPIPEPTATPVPVETPTVAPEPSETAQPEPSETSIPVPETEVPEVVTEEPTAPAEPPQVPPP